MRVGIVTYYTNNYGSVLQCYATVFCLKKLGIEAIVLDHKEKRFIEEKLWNLSLKCRFMLARIRDNKFDRHYRYIIKNKKNELQSSDNRFNDLINRFIYSNYDVRRYSYSELKMIANSHEYDVIICGSDQIWNSTSFVPNPFYYLTFCPPFKKVALAPSFGTNYVFDCHKSFYKKQFKSFSLISTREKSGAKLISELSGRNDVVELCDPVVFLNSDEWRALYRDNTNSIAIGSEYIVAFFLNTPSENAIRYLKSIHKTVIALSYNYSVFSDLDNTKFYIASPEEWVGFIDNALLVCTDSFHAMMFSCILHSDFWVFERQYNGQVNQNERITSFLRSVELENRFINDFRQLEDSSVDFHYFDDWKKDQEERSLKFFDSIKEIVNYNDKRE